MDVKILLIKISCISFIVDVWSDYKKCTYSKLRVAFITLCIREYLGYHPRAVLVHACYAQYRYYRNTTQEIKYL